MEIPTVTTQIAGDTAAATLNSHRPKGFMAGLDHSIAVEKRRRPQLRMRAAVLIRTSEPQTTDVTWP
jgi:hypothetical protein